MFKDLFARPFRSRYELAWRRDMFIMLLVGMLALLAAAVTPAHSQSTIFLTDRNGQIPFPILPPNRATGGPGFIDNMTIGATTPRPGTFTTLGYDSQACEVTPCVLLGLGAAQGGSIQVKGGTSSTSANAGGAAAVTGGDSGATGVGGAATVAGGSGGTTSGNGGAASLTGGSSALSGNGGAASVAGGAGAGTGNGGGAIMQAGGSGAGATGNGGDLNLAGGIANSTNGNGGSVILTPAVKAGSGIDGKIFSRGVQIVTQAAPVAATTSATLTAANLLVGIITVNQGAAGASAQQLPDGTAMDAAMPDVATGDAFDFSVINISTVTAEVATVTTNTGWTLVGGMDVLANEAGTKSSGRFRALRTGTATWTLYRIS